MALDFTGLMTVAGEIIKKIDIFNALIASLETYKDDIYTDLNAEGFQDYYAVMPAQFLSMKNTVSSWITTLKTDLTSILLDPDLILDELPISPFDITSVLNGLYDYMDDNSETIETSVVTLGGADANSALVSSEGTSGVLTTAAIEPILFCHRLLDGTNSPGNNVSAHTRYNGIESQLARTATVYAKLLSNTTIGSETALMFSELPISGPYLSTTESPGPGPTLRNPEANNVITSNAKFDTWVGDSPTGWSMSGTITTDYIDASGTGAGPLRIKTAGVTASRQITTLVHNKMYFMGLYGTTSFGVAGPITVKLRLKTLSGTLVGSLTTLSVNDAAFVAYQFFTLADTVNLSDLYVEIEYDAETDAADYAEFKKVVIAPATYYNGLAWAWWPVHHTAADASKVPIDDLRSMAISNNNNGKFQTAFRRLYNIQLPTADAPTVNDALAGG